MKRHRGCARWYVNVDHLCDEQLEFFGFYKITEDAAFACYGNPMDESTWQVLPQRNTGPRFVMVDDVNDAQHMKSSVTIKAP